MNTLKNIILTLCIISFFSLSTIENISNASYISSHKQANIAFVGFNNSGKTALKARLAGEDYPFNDFERYPLFPTNPSCRGLIVDYGQNQKCAIDCKLWDTCCHPKNKDKTVNSVCKYMDVVVITLSLNVPNWREEIAECVRYWKQDILKVNPNAKIILACTKSDLIHDHELLNEIETTIDDFTKANRGLDESLQSVVLSALTEHNLDILTQMIVDYLKEIGIDNLRDIHEKLPCEPTEGICLLL